MSILIKHVPNIDDDYVYGVIYENSYSNKNYYNYLKYDGALTKDLEDYRFKSHSGDGDDFVFFKTETQAVGYASILHLYLLKTKRLLVESKKQKKAKLKLLEKPKILYIIPETWYSKIRIFLNV